MDNIHTVIGVIVSILTMVSYFGTIWILFTAARSILSGRNAHWDTLIFTAIVLMAIPQVIETYPQTFLASVNYSLIESMDEMEQIEANLNEWAIDRIPANQDVPSTVITVQSEDAQPAQEGCEVFVEKGDSMLEIAIANGTTIEQIDTLTEHTDFAANGYQIGAGTILKVC